VTNETRAPLDALRLMALGARRLRLVRGRMQPPLDLTLKTLDETLDAPASSVFGGLRPSVGVRRRVSLGRAAFYVLALRKGENIRRSNVECFYDLPGASELCHTMGN
jgi:hypothetical protein